MITLKERRLRCLERQLGLGSKLEYPFIFFDARRYKDEPDELIIGVRMGDVNWERGEEESVEVFKERVCKDIRKNFSGKVGHISFIRDHSGLPEPTTEMPAYTPYPEVLKRIKISQEGT